MAKTFLEAADEIMRAAEGPLTAREITERALARGLLTTHGRTPHETMSSDLYKAAARGKVKRVYEPGLNRARRGSVYEPGLNRARRGSVRWLPVDSSSEGVTELRG